MPAQTKSEARFWNYPVETFPRDQLDALRLRRLKRLLAYAYARSRFYRERWDAVGFHPDRVQSLEDFQRMAPLTDKADFLEYQERYPHYGITVAVGETDIAHHAETSGSTGIPLRIPFTAYDTERYGELDPETRTTLPDGAIGENAHHVREHGAAAHQLSHPRPRARL